MLKSRKEFERNNSHYLERCTSQTSSQHYIFMCVIMFLCVCMCAFVWCLHANNSTGLVIRGKRAFHWSHGAVSETGNGTHTLHSKPEENSLWAALYHTHTHTHTHTLYTHYIQRQTGLGLKHTLHYTSITAQDINIRTAEESRLMVVLHLKRDTSSSSSSNHFITLLISLLPHPF